LNPDFLQKHILGLVGALNTNFVPAEAMMAILNRLQFEVQNLSQMVSFKERNTTTFVNAVHDSGENFRRAA